MGYEIKTCKEGETNSITKEHFCNLHKDFCKFLPNCFVKSKNKK